MTAVPRAPADKATAAQCRPVDERVEWVARGARATAVPVASEALEARPRVVRAAAAVRADQVAARMRVVP